MDDCLIDCQQTLQCVKSAKIIVTNKEKLEMQQCLSVGVLGLPSPHLVSPELDTPSYRAKEVSKSHSLSEVASDVILYLGVVI